MLLLHSIQDNTPKPSKISVLKVIVFAKFDYGIQSTRLQMAFIQGRLLRTSLLLKTMCCTMFVFFGMFTKDNTHIKTTCKKVRFWDLYPLTDPNQKQSQQRQCQIKHKKAAFQHQTTRQERQKSNTFMKQNNNFARAALFFAF